MELFHYEYQHEERQYLQQKEKEEDEKLQAVLQYTRNAFLLFVIQNSVCSKSVI